MSRGRVLGVVFMLLAVNYVTSKPQPSEPFDHQAVLAKDDTYHMFWKFDEKSITFEVHVKTKGYVGFGLSPNGGMKDSDIVIGWVKDGEAYFQDRFAEGNRMPTVDPQQDWELLSGIETDSHTVLKFRRDLVACDTRDRTIGENTMRVIWAYHSDDPDSEDRIPYHENGRRGTKSIYLIQKVSPPSVMPPDVITYDFIMPRVTIPAKRTTYWCHNFVVPKMAGHHVIKMEPVVQEGNENYVYNMQLLLCTKPMDESSHNMSAVCSIVNWSTCTTLVYVWAVGGGAFYLPAHAGMPFGEEDQPGLYLLEVHYDNQMETPGIIDNSGLRITMTPTIRTYDVGTLYVGGTADPNLFIPPGYESLRVRRICSSSCLSQHIPDEGIKFFASLLYTHVLGVELQIYHFRNGEQLLDSDLGTDHSYDYNYQEYRVFDEITVLKNDTIVLDCVYDSSSRSGITYGGLATTDEMCMGYLLYYPKMDLTHCASNVLPQYLVLTVGEDVELNAKGIVEEPDWLANRTWTDVLEKEVDWKQSSKRQTFQDLVLTSDQVSICFELSWWDPMDRYILPAMNVTRKSTGSQECSSLNAGSQMAIKYWTIVVSTLSILVTMRHV